MNFMNNRNIRAKSIGTPNVQPIHAARKEFLKSDNFNLHFKIHEFREASPESLYLTGTPSVNVLRS